jgi:superfamily II DNA or RNA helicase
MLPAPELAPDSPIQDVFRALATDDSRNRCIAEDVLAAYREGRKVLVLTERTDHLPLLQGALGDEIEHFFLLHGRLSRKQRMAVFAELESLDESTPRVLLATGRLIGEGFDHPPLDTLVLAMPISWKGTLQQYAGRLHREHVEKRDVRIHDYAEIDQPQLARMWARRQRGYRAMGYELKTTLIPAAEHADETWDA